MPSQKTPIALIYDFDGTLAPGDMPNKGLLPALGVPAEKAYEEFWDDIVNANAAKMNIDSTCSYLLELVKLGQRQGRPLTKSMLESFGQELTFFPGVEGWFAAMVELADMLDVEIHHYVISSGLSPMIKACPIAHNFKAVFACDYVYNENGEAFWPAVALNYTNKTQFLFRINKGVLNNWNNKDVNRHMKREERPQPFSHMIYFGDGFTDVPSMKMTRHQGGHAIAVYDEEDQSALLRATELIAQERANFAAPADFRKDKLLYATVAGIIKHLADKDWDR